MFFWSKCAHIFFEDNAGRGRTRVRDGEIQNTGAKGEAEVKAEDDWAAEGRDRASATQAQADGRSCL